MKTSKSKVYFTKVITPESLVNMYKILNRDLKGNVAVKTHSGEPGGNNYLKPEFMKQLVDYVNGTIVECNTAYAGRRNTESDHMKVMQEHGFAKIAKVDIMDGEGEMKLPLEGGKHLKFNIVGTHLNNYDSMIMLSHFKGHAMGGFGGALKNMSIGVASRNGKAYIHSAGKTEDANVLWDNIAPQDDFLESMAEADKTIMEHFKDNIVYINCMVNLSIDCDCDSHPEAPCMKDIGILSSLDPVALDKACLDLVYASSDPGRDHLLERIESRHGDHTVDYAEQIGLGSTDYELIDVDKE